MYFSLFISGIAVAHEIPNDRLELIEPVLSHGELEIFCVREAHFFLCGNLPPPAGLRMDPGHCQILARLGQDPYYWGVDRVPLSDLTAHAAHIANHEQILTPYLRRHSPPVTGYRAICDAVDSAPRRKKKDKTKASKGPFAVLKQFDTFFEHVLQENRTAELAERFRNGEPITGQELETLFVRHGFWDGLQARTKSWMGTFLTRASIDGATKSTGAPLTGLRLEAFEKAFKQLIELVGPAGNLASPGHLEHCQCCAMPKTDTRLVRGNNICAACLAERYFRCTDCEQYHPIDERNLLPGWFGIELCPACKMSGMGKNFT